MPFPNKTFNNNSIAIKAGKKGGKNYTEKQRLAQTLGQWKRYGVNPKLGQKVMMLIESRDFTAADWFKHIDLLESIAEQDPKFLPMLTNMKKDWANFTHGSKPSTQVNIQTNDANSVVINIINPNDVNDNLETEQ